MLVLADHTARITTIAACFGTETRRVGGQFDRKLVGGKDFTANGIGQCDFGSRDEIQVFAFTFLSAFFCSKEVFREFG